MHSFHPYKSPAALLLCSLSYFLLFSSVYAADATLYLSPPAGTYTVNDHAMIRVFVSSDGAPISGVEGTLTFDPLKMNVVSVSHEASVLTSWPTPPSFDNEKGEIYFGGVMSTSTVLDRGHIMSVVITPLRAEDFRLAFASGAAILAGDGTGGNIVSSLKPGDYTGIPRGEYVASPALMSSVLLEYGSSSTPSEITAAESEEIGTSTENSTDEGEVLGTTTKREIITSPSHPDQNAWYAFASSTLMWDTPEGVVSLRLSLNKKPDGGGIVHYNMPMNEKIINNIPEGVQYFHLTREWSDGHTDDATYQLQTDMTPPAGLTLTEKPRDDTTDPRVVLLISATDTLSGVEQYEITIDNNAPLTWTPDEAGEYHVPPLSPGAHEIMVRAIDKAGNAASARLSFSIEYLPAPILSLNDEKRVEGMHFSGNITATPNGIATLYIKRGTELTQEEIPLPREGSASFTSVLTLLPGAYEVWVITHDARGAISPESEHVTFEATPSWLGIIKRHPLIPIVTIIFVAFLFSMRFFWKKMNAPGHPDDNDDIVDEIHQTSHPRQSEGSTVVLTAVKRKQGISIS